MKSILLSSLMLLIISAVSGQNKSSDERKSIAPRDAAPGITRPAVTGSEKKTAVAGDTARKAVAGRAESADAAKQDLSLKADSRSGNKATDAGRIFISPMGDTMKKYFFCLYLKGNKRDQDSATAKEIGNGHMNFISKGAASGVIQVAGPFDGDTDWRGILILDLNSKEEAEALMKTDPAVASGRLSYRIEPWWGGIGSRLK